MGQKNYKSHTRTSRSKFKYRFLIGDGDGRDCPYCHIPLPKRIFYEGPTKKIKLSKYKTILKAKPCPFCKKDIIINTVSEESL
jgi:hypothetical protein